MNADDQPRSVSDTSRTGSATPGNKTADQAIMFANRIEKQWKHLRKWARRTGVTCYRLYDRDIPEIPLACDLYTDSETGDIHLHIALYERPYEKDEEEEEKWLEAMRLAAADILSVPEIRVHSKLRKKQRGEESQYERISRTGRRFPVDEGGARLLVNLRDYLDTGLFLDHRPARALVRATSSGKRVLNLFCYTGAFSVQAAAGGALSVTSVDLSKTYLAWAADNLEANGFRPGEFAIRMEESRDAGNFPCVHADVKAYLAWAFRSGLKWDIVVCDPPTFSNSKRSADILDVNRDWPELCRMSLALLSPGGVLYFSTNSRTLKFDPDLVGGAATRPGTVIEDITESSIPEDFRNRKIHRMWRFTLP